MSDRPKIAVRIKATGNLGHLYQRIDDLLAAGVTRTLVYYVLPTGTQYARQVALDELEEVS